MPITIRSFAKINLGLKIGPARADGFHELRTIYQTVALHDVVHVDVQPGSGIEIRCNDPRVPLDASNTCYKVAERVMKVIPQGLKPDSENSHHGTAEAVPFQNQNHELTRASKVVIEIEKQLPVQGGMGAASSNAVAAMFGLEKALGTELVEGERQRIAEEVGSDLPLFLVGGTVLGTGRGERVQGLPDIAITHLVVVTPAVGVSTPAAFQRWDELAARESGLTAAEATGTIEEFGQGLFARLSEMAYPQARPASGVPAMGGDRAETLLLDLVRAGTENDFERVIFPEYPELREAKRVLQREGASYASLSGSGSTLYGLFDSADEAQTAARRVSAAGYAAVATKTLTRREYWDGLFL
ncbi:MAG: 4-(cytidine 5'-diphospho)-2-C-methyl-D-erythritol kinase [Acidobacteriota bacterium]|nr:4-(cytidine 5'-diphospho)-2-C-methyl-D-erythritol kinase [Acidobacteriota bacterium]